MIDFALQAERDHDLPRCRPWIIRMGVGSELRKPLGITIVGGLIVSQMLTLFTTPVVYLFFDRLQWRLMKPHRLGV